MFILSREQFERTRAAVAATPPAAREQAYALLQQAKEAKDPAQAAALYARVQKLNPQLADLHRAFANQAVERKDFVTAAAEFKTYLEYDFSCGVAWQLAEIYRDKLNNPTEAGRYFRLYSQFREAEATLFIQDGAYPWAMEKYRKIARYFMDAERYDLAGALGEKGVALCESKKLGIDRAAMECYFYKGYGLYVAGKPADGATLMKKGLDLGLNKDDWFVQRFRVTTPAKLTLAKNSFPENAPIVIKVVNGNNPAHEKDWVGLYEAAVVPNGNPSSIWNAYLPKTGAGKGGSTITFDPAQISAGKQGRYKAGSYKIIFAFDDSYRIEAWSAFTVK